MGVEHEDRGELLTALEQHIVELLEELGAAIAALAGDDEELYPLAEFDQRLLLEHAQIIQRYVLAQAAARRYPDRYRLIGSGSPRTMNSGDGQSVEQHSSDEHVVGDHGHPHLDHDHDATTHLHHVADPESARKAHQMGRAIIGEHPWEQDHDHAEGHSHADEWEWESLTQEPPSN